jgi:DNA modification methylase
MQAGWEEVVGVERETEYVEIAKARLAYWLRKQNGFDRRGLC